MARRLRWVAPPGWPTPPPGWSPGSGWVPDASWPPPPEGWQWWRRAPRIRAERSTEAVLWNLAVAVPSIAGGVYVHDVGVDGRLTGPVLAWLFGLLGGCCVAVGIRQRGTAWWTTPAYATTFAIVVGWILLVLIGPGSGTPGACGPDEACDIEQGLGIVTGPILLLPFFITVILVGRALAALVAKIATQRHA